MLTGEPAAVQGADAEGGAGDAGALDVDVPLRTLLVDKDVQHPAVLATLLHDVVTNVRLPVRLRLPKRRKTKLLNHTNGACTSSRM